jgi:MFS family permease
MHTTYGFLWRDHHVRGFLAASVAGRLCFSMLPLGIVLFSSDVSGSFAIAGAATGIFGVASAVLSPARGHLVDRIGWRALAGLSVAFGVALGAFLAVGLALESAAAVIALAGVSGALVPPIGAAARDVWGAAFRERESRRHALYAADTALEEGMLVAGPLLVGGIVALASSEAAVAAAAIGVVLSGTISAITTLGRTLGPQRDAEVGGIRAGISRPLLLLVTSLAGPALALGCLEVAVPAFAGDHGSVAWAGPLLAVVSAGSMAGGIWYGTRPQRSREERYLIALCLFAILLLPPILAMSLPVMATLLLLPGLVLGPLFILLYELVDRAASEGHRTGAFSLVIAVNNGSVGVGAAAAGALVAALDPWAGFALASATAAVGAVSAWWFARSEPRRATP